MHMASCVLMCCSVLQYVAECCSVLKCVWYNVLQCVVQGVLQDGAVCVLLVLQYVM